MTIVEVAITSALLMIILLAIFNTLDSVSSSQAFQADRTKNLDDMRTILNKMTKELRQASTVSESTSTASSITFTTSINDVATQITYNASGTTLTKKTGSAAAFPVLTNLASTSLFNYVTADSITGVQWVEINLQVTPARRPTTTLVLDSEINLRNRTAALEGQ